MSGEPAIDHVPYREWLQLQVNRRPQHPYELLGLKPLETDPVKIRIAINRQQSLMEAKRPEAKPEVWDAINKELDEAIDVLFDPDKKVLLDASLKRQQRNQAPPGANAGGGGGGAAANAMAAGGAFNQIKCRECSVMNPPNRRYCAGCGAPLFDKCPQCNNEVTAEEKFCGTCGANLYETLRRQEEEIEEKVQQARVMQREYRFGEAALILRQLAIMEDSRFERFAKRAIDLLDRFGRERKELEDRALRQVERAEKYLVAHAYEKALERLLDIPDALRTPDMTEMIADVRAKRNEILSLGGEIREGLEKDRKFELLPKIERLLALKPDHEQAREIAEKLRNDILRSAKKRMLAHSYEEARSMIESIPQFVRNEDVERLADQAEELDSIATDIRLSPVVTDAVVNMSDRLCKIAASNEGAGKQLAELKKKRVSKPSDPRLLYPSWGTPPRRTLLGMPLEWMGYFTRLGECSEEHRTTLIENPGRFFVAFGLALQAIEKANVQVNLAFEKATNILSGMTSMSFSKKIPKSGWGIDLSPTGLKAIKLAPELKDGHAQIVEVVFIPHSQVLTHGDGELDKHRIMEETLKAFKEKFATTKEKDRVVIALPSQRVLGRFFDLPPMAAKKLLDAVQFEAKHQIPIPLDELAWAHQVLREGEGKSADTEPRHVMLVAAKDFQMKERLAPFKAIDVHVDAVTAEAIALHNMTHNEFFGDPEAPDRFLGMLDVGVEGSSFVVSSRKSIWFRTVGIGADDVNDNLIKNFQLTYGQAEELKRNPHKAKRFHLLQESLHPLFVQIGSEIERSLSSYLKQFPDRSVDRVYGVGGGFAQHGLLRYLIHGR